MEDTLLEVRDLQVEFSTKMGSVRVLDKVNLKVDPRQTVGIIGESGCGKSMMALSIMGLVPIPAGPGSPEAKSCTAGPTFSHWRKTPSSTSGESGSP